MPTVWEAEADRGAQLLDALAGANSLDEAQQAFEKLSVDDKRAVALWGVVERRHALEGQRDSQSYRAWAAS